MMDKIMPERFTGFLKDDVEQFTKAVVYDILNDLTNADLLGADQVKLIQHIAKKYGVLHSR
jgi:hypothetical protein